MPEVLIVCGILMAITNLSDGDLLLTVELMDFLALLCTLGALETIELSPLCMHL